MSGSFQSPRVWRFVIGVFVTAVTISVISLIVGVVILICLPFSRWDRPTMFGYLQTCLNLPVAVASAAIILTGVEAIKKLFGPEPEPEPPTQGKLRPGGKK